MKWYSATLVLFTALNNGDRFVTTARGSNQNAECESGGLAWLVRVV